MACVNVAIVGKTNTLEYGRQSYNANDQSLADAICNFLLTSSYVHTEAVPATTWTINHGLTSEYLIYSVKDTSGYKIYPATEREVTTDQIVLTFSQAVAGKCVVFLGRAGFVTPGDSTVGTPTDGSWEDGYTIFNPAGILASDPIKDAIDKLNETLARIVPPPALLQDELTVEHLPGLSFQSARLSSGSGQNFNTLAAGQLFTNITVSDGIELQTPASPTGQFGRADAGTIKFFGNGAEEDTFDLETAFDELERDGSQTYPGTIDGVGDNNLIEIMSVEMASNMPQYQQGDFRVSLVGWLQTGENYTLYLKHTVNAVEYNTDPKTIFYDDGNVPAVSGTPELLEYSLSGGVYKYLDGIRYYKSGDVLSVVSLFDDSYNRTYSPNIATLALPGFTTANVAYNASLVHATRAASFMNDAFPTGAIDTDKWTVSSPAPTQASNRLELTNLTPTAAVTKYLASNAYLVRKTGFAVSAVFGIIAPSSSGGWQAGLRLNGTSDSRVEFLYREDDASSNTVEAWFTPDGGSRTAHASAALTISGVDTLVLKITNTTTDTYRFEYNKNGAGFVQLGVDLTFSDWDPVNNYKLQSVIFATNQVDTNLPSFSVYADTYTVASGRATIYDAAPDKDDKLELLGYQITINNANQNSNNARLSVTPLSVRGTSSTVQSASENRLLNTYTSPSTDLIEYFLDNDYRLPDDTYLVAPISPTGNWTDTSVLPVGEAHVFNGKLVYPSADFTSGYSPTQQGGTDFSGRTGGKTYLRSFLPVSPKTSGTLRITGVTLANLLDDDVTVEIMVPSATGWLSLNDAYDDSTFTGVDGDGCRTTSSGSDFSFTLGEFSTGDDPDTGDSIIVRITLPTDSSIEITHLESLAWDT